MGDFVKKLIIEKIEGIKYSLIDDKNVKYNLTLEFHDLENPIKEKNIIYINEETLKNPNTLYSFGSLSSKYGKVVTPKDYEDLLILIVDNKEIYLKRLYG